MEMKIKFQDKISLAVTDVVPDLRGLHQGKEILHIKARDRLFTGTSQRMWDVRETRKGMEFCEGIWRQSM